jgi:hypothetical protein
MTAAVIDAPTIITEPEAELIRSALERLGDDDRRSMWSVLELIDRQIDAGASIDRLERAVALAPHEVRATVARVAALRLERLRPERTGSSVWHPLPAGHRPLTTIVGRCTEHDVWTSTGWKWASFAPEALEPLGYRRHDPVAVLYRHAGPPIGITRRLTLTENRDLDLEAMLLPEARSQWAARFVRSGELRGLSPGVTVRHSEWTFLSPREWEPSEGRLDLCRRHRVDLEEVSLTPTPAQPACTVRAWW